MAAGTWKVYARAKRIIGAGGSAMTSGGITLGTGVFKMSLHRPSASAAILALSTRSTFASIPGEVSARGGYVAGGRNLPPATGKWTVGASAKQYKFTYTASGLVFTASGSTISNIKYALIRTSSGAGAGKVLCFVTLTGTAFNLTSGNTLTIAPHANGVFTMA